MKKLLFAILSCFIVSVVVADTLPKVNLDMGASYNDIMNVMDYSEIRMDAIRPVLLEFHLVPNKDKNCDYYFKDHVFDVLNSGEKIERLHCVNSVLHIPDAESFVKRLRTKLQMTKKLTLRVLYDVCMPEAMSVPFDWYYNNGEYTGLFDKIEERLKKRGSAGNAEETCDMFIQMIVVKHNQLVGR